MTAPSTHLLADLALSDCTYLRNFTRRDLDEFWDDCVPWNAQPVLEVFNETSLPDGSFVWSVTISNPIGVVANAVDVIWISGLPLADIDVFRFNGVQRALTSDGAGGVVFDAANAHLIQPGYNQTLIYSLTFLSSVRPGLYPAIAALHQNSAAGPVIASDTFQVQVRSTAIGPVIFGVIPNHGEASGGTDVRVRCLNLDQVAGLGVAPVVNVGGQPLINTAWDGISNDITGTTSPMLPGNKDSHLVEIIPSIDPPIRAQNKWTWDIIDWDDTETVGTWQSVAPGVDWSEGLQLKSGQEG